MAVERLCICPDPDPVRCYDLLHYGYTPVLRGQPYAEHYYVMQETLTFAEMDDGECECVCHRERAVEVEDEGGGENGGGLRAGGVRVAGGGGVGDRQEPVEGGREDGDD